LAAARVSVTAVLAVVALPPGGVTLTESVIFSVLCFFCAFRPWGLSSLTVNVYFPDFSFLTVAVPIVTGFFFEGFDDAALAAGSGA
jgi:hypothetical protein